MISTKETQTESVAPVQDETQGTRTPLWQRLLFSDTVLKLSPSRKITYIALLTAFTVVANTFLEYKFFAVQFSLTIVVSVLAGVLLGSAFGFIACFLGDLIGFVLHPFGIYLPFIGISTGLMAVFGFLCVCRLPLQGKFAPYLKILLANLAIFLVCTSGITTLTLNATWYTSLTYFECLTMRLFVEGQIWNTLFNAVVLFIGLPSLGKIKPLGLHF
ncbi:MAG: ECF transporter S component [Clostridia bacterium]|nr:ECF transporter S component [Clostridia bacterium]